MGPMNFTTFVPGQGWVPVGPQGPQNVPQGAMTSAPTQPPAQPPIFPTAAPASPYGAPLPPVPEMSRREQGLDTIYNAFGGMAGRLANAAPSPWANQHSQRLQNYQLQSQRLQAARSLASRADSTPEGRYKRALQEGLFELNPGENIAQGFQRYTQERFKTSPDSVYEQKMSDLTGLMGGDRTLATKLGNNLLEVRNDPYGAPGVYDLSTGEFVSSVTPDQIAAGKELIASTSARGVADAEANAGFRQKAIETLRSSSAEEAVLQGALDTSEAFLERFEAGDLDGATGMVSGFFSQLGFGPEPLGELSADQVRMTLANLGITNLAPVTVREIMMVNQMWAEASAGKDINTGRLKSAIKNIRRALSDLEHERNRSLGELRRYGDQSDYDYYYQQYGTVDSLEELLNGGQ